jgi:glycosyltransferase involved in cell wall biosynthesis
MTQTVLQVSLGFKPNMGGLETHLSDLVSVLDANGWRSIVLTYMPITTSAKAKIYENGRGLEVIRIPWIGGWFYKLVANPLLEFAYLVPGLFFVLPFILMIHWEIKVIHSHGLIAGFPAVIWGRIFNKRVLVTTHSIYNFPPNGPYRAVTRWIFNLADVVLTLSRQSSREVTSLGISNFKVRQFTYWVDLNRYKKIKSAKRDLGWENKFVVFFAGRLVEEKGVAILLQAAKSWNRSIYLFVAGTGPLEDEVIELSKQNKNIVFLGRLEPEKMPMFYSGADLYIIPSIHEEGFGRVILESLACGTPVIGSLRGAIPEAMDNSVGRLIDISSESIKQTVEGFYRNRRDLVKLANNCREFAQKRYSCVNAKLIIQSYNS